MGGATAGAPLPRAEDWPSRAETTGWVEYRPGTQAGRVVLLLAAEEEIAAQPSARCRLTMAGCDLSLLASGRAPLMLDHLRAVEHLAGVIEEAWIDEGRLFAVARLAGTPRLAETRRLLRERVLRNCSMGVLMRHAREPGPDGVHSVLWWRPYEVSLCTVPAGWLEAPRVIP